LLSDLVPVLWRELPALLDDVGCVLASIDRDYADFLAEERLMVTAAAQVAVRELVDTAEQHLSGGPSAPEVAATEPPGAASEDQRGFALALFEEAGRDQARRNRPLLTLLLAYRAGGRVAWRHIAACAVVLEMPADALAALAEAVFRAVDEISTVSTEGYLLEQAESGGVREQLLAALAERLLEDGADPEQLRQLAQQASWTLPAEAAVVLVRPGDRAGPTALARLSSTCLHVRWGEFLGVIVPDPRTPGTRQRLAAVLRSCAAAVGPSVPLRDLPESARVTRDAVTIGGTAWSDRRPLFVEDHMDAVIVHRDERLLEALRGRCLAPLQGAAKGSREALRDTLRSWLVHMGDGRAVAAELQVHPQTVRYRMSRLHELFDPVLNDPNGRLRLLLALAWDCPKGDREPDREPERPRGIGPRRPRAAGAGDGMPRQRTRGGVPLRSVRPAVRRGDGAGSAAARATGARR
jgi:hypothetical protein